MAEPAKHYTVRRLAEEKWGVSPSHVYDLIDRKELKALRIGNAIRIPVEYVAEYEAEHRIWQENAERKPSIASEESPEARTGISAGQKVESLNGYQRARLSANRRKPSSQTT